MNAISKASAFPATVQPGLPKYGQLLSGWTREPIGKHLREVRRPISMQDDASYRLVTAKRARGGVVPREELTGNEIAVKSQFRIEDGDFLISKRQIVHGACGLVPPTLDGAIVSNEYAVLRACKSMDPRFLAYLSHSTFFQQTCFHSSIGVHIEKMIFKLDRWLKWEFDLPPLPEQQKIAEMLSTWDKAIETAEKLLANAEAQKRALMQQLLTGKRRLKGFDELEWTLLPFDRVFQVSNNKATQVQKKDYRPTGEIPIVDQGQDFIAGYADGQSVYEDVPVIVFGDHTRVLKWVDFKFRPGADGVQILKARPGIFQRFGYYALQGLHLPNLGYSRHMRELKKAVFRMPRDLHEQTSIADVLSDCEKEVELRASNLTHLISEKSALMQQLLTGKRRVKP